MRIALVMHIVTHIAGTERFNIEISKRLTEKGHEVALFIETCEPLLPIMPKVEVNIVERKARRQQPNEMIKSLKKVFGNAMAWNPDIILASDASLMTRYVAASFTKRTKTLIIPYIHTAERQTPYVVEHRVRAMRRIGRALHIDSPIFTRPYLREFRLILCNSRFTERVIKEMDRKANTCKVYPGVDFEFYSNGFSQSIGSYFFNQGWITAQKNHIFLLQLAKHFDHKFVICGLFDFRMKKRLPQLDHLMNERKDNVKIVLNAPEGSTPMYLRDCFAYLNPAINEGFGLAMLESMASGKPVIAMNSGAHPEVLEDGGVLCEPIIQDWIIQCNKLLSDSELYKEIREKGRKRAKEFTWEETVDGIIDAIESL